MDKATEIIKRQERLAGDRGTWEGHWQEITDLMAPFRNDITATRTPGEKRQQKIFDGTALLAVDQLANGLWGMVTNSANEWFTLKAEEDDLAEDFEVAQWLGFAGDRIRSVFAMNGLRFYSSVLDLYADLVTLGTGVFSVEEIVGKGIQFLNHPLQDTYIAENDVGEIDLVIRKFRWTARQAHQRWGDKAGEKVLKALETNPDQVFCFLHAVMPNSEQKYGKIDRSGMAFSSCYVSLEGKQIVEEGGYLEFPYMVPRWSTKSRGLYGDSPAMVALPDVKMLNAMSKTNLIGAQKIVDPPILAPDERTARGIRTHPGGIIYGGMNEKGARYMPLQTGGRPDIGLELEEQRRSVIREAFYHSLMLMIQQPNQTATEILARQEEKLRLMGPALGRIQSEFLDPLIDRVFAIMLRAKQFGPVENIPEPLRQAGIKVEYVSPLAKAQKASDGASIMRYIGAVMPLAEVKPEVLAPINWEKTSRALADSFGMRADLLLSPEDVAAMAQQEAKKQAMMTAMSAAKPMAGALKDAAQAQQIANQPEQAAA